MPITIKFDGKDVTRLAGCELSAKQISTHDSIAEDSKHALLMRHRVVECK